MIVKPTTIEGVYEIYPRVFEDERGYFLESFQLEKLREQGIDVPFVQDNQSFSKKGVLRGLHLQLPPYEQDKLIGVVWGSVIDVVVDVRPSSPTFGRWEAFRLDAREHKRLFVPKGMAHGFVTLEDTVFVYKCSEYYHPEAEAGIVWNDPALAIDWGTASPIVSAKDQQLPTFEEFCEKLLPKIKEFYAL